MATTTTAVSSEKMDAVFMCKMSEALKARVIKRATKDGCSASAIIRQAIAQYLHSANDEQRERAGHLPDGHTCGKPVRPANGEPIQQEDGQ